MSASSISHARAKSANAFRRLESRLLRGAACPHDPAWITDLLDIPTDAVLAVSGADSNKGTVLDLRIDAARAELPSRLPQVDRLPELPFRVEPAEEGAPRSLPVATGRVAGSNELAWSGAGFEAADLGLYGTSSPARLRLVSREQRGSAAPAGEPPDCPRRRWRRYFVPVAFAVVTLLALGGLDLLGAECYESSLDGPGNCNDLGAAQEYVRTIGIILTALTLPLALAGAYRGLRHLGRRLRRCPRGAATRAIDSKGP